MRKERDPRDMESSLDYRLSSSVPRKHGIASFSVLEWTCILKKDQEYHIEICFTLDSLIRHWVLF